MKVYLVWTSYEYVEAVFYKEEDANKWIDEYIVKQPTFGGYRKRERSDFGVTDYEVQ